MEIWLFAIVEGLEVMLVTHDEARWREDSGMQFVWRRPHAVEAELCLQHILCYF